MLIKNLKEENVNEIVNVHMISFSDFFLTSLGFNFLKIYYSSCLKNRDTIAIGMFDENEKLNGFAIGALNASGYYKKILLNNFFRFFISLIEVVIKKPSVLVRLVLNLNKSPKKNDRKKYAELLSIAVLPNLKGSGLGKELLEKFEANSKFLGAKKCALTTDFYDNESVLNFYKKNNYEIYYEFITYPNRKMYKMIKDLIKY